MCCYKTLGWWSGGTPQALLGRVVSALCSALSETWGYWVLIRFLPAPEWALWDVGASTYLPILLAESQRGSSGGDCPVLGGGCGEDLVPPSLSRSGHKEQLCILAVSFSERTQAEPLFFFNEGGLGW